MRKARYFNVIIEGFRGVKVWLANVSANVIATVIGNGINDS